MKKVAVLFVFLFSLTSLRAQEEFTELELSVDKYTDGTLTLPSDSSDVPLVIFIQGSGPTNRDGNQPMMKNNGMKKLAQELATQGIASYRFDKRIFKMNKFGIKEEDLRFEDFVKDVQSIVEHFNAEEKFSKIILSGHSEGALLATLAAGENVDALISLAGAGRSIDKVIVEQIAKQSEELSENAKIAFDEIKNNGQTTKYSQYLESIFRPSVQPYIASWMKYDPAEELAKTDIPVLIVNGTFDLQVDVTDAEILKEARPEAELVLIENMNHIFRKIEGENLENTKAYNEPQRPLHPELVPELVEFIRSIK